MPGSGRSNVKDKPPTGTTINLLQGMGISEEGSEDRKEGEEEQYDQPLSECFKKLIENNII